MTILRTCRSITGVPIRLTDTQWEHILAARPYLQELQDSVMLTVEVPEEVYAPAPSIRPQLHAIKTMPQLARRGIAEILAVVYREVHRQDGFIITAFPITREKKKERYREWRRVYP